MLDNYIEQYQPNKRHIYIGDLTAATNLNFIHAQIGTGKGSVITAALGMDQLDYSQLNINHIVYPLLDNKRQNISQFFANFYEIVQQQIKVGNILVHCSAGISRSPTLVISYIMKKQNWTFSEAIAFVRKSGRKVLPNLGFQRQLKAYESSLKLKKNSSIELRKKTCVTSDAKNKYSRNKINLAKLPNINLLSLKHTPVQLIDPQQEIPQPPNTKRQATHQIRRIKLKTSDSNRQQSLIRELQIRRSIPQSQKLEINNFQVMKVHINERVLCRKKILPRFNLQLS